MTNKEPLAGMTFENLKNIEAELFAKKNKNKAAKEGGKPEDAGNDRAAWKLNQEVLDAKKESAALRNELEQARTRLTEQDVLTASSLSALKELNEDFNRQKALLDEKEASQYELRSEIRRLNSQLNLKKRNEIELGGNLAREAALRKEAETLLLESRQKEAELRRQIGLSAVELKAKFFAVSHLLREEKPRRFAPGNY